MHVFPGLCEQLIHDGDCGRFEPEAEFDGISGDEATRGGGHPVGLVPRRGIPEGLQLLRH